MLNTNERLEKAMTNSAWGEGPGKGNIWKGTQTPSCKIGKNLPITQVNSYSRQRE